MKKATFHEDADAEMIEAAKFYEERSSNLGFSFLAAVEEAVIQICDNPKAYPLLGDDIRRKLVKRFPYGVIFAEEHDRIRIVAIAHLKRRPEYWRYRLATEQQ
ncbi:MAG: type II toxin-antitoxin system RelE/ParE family toxin [Deltaproteobacteria bacterium]|nr:type II toxin-antitoxin system RelE/ParE family toxin [Deltaproteobacteria bacterium]